jgi:glycosyltransferase involved in cell wall biosynthesis
MIEPVCLTTGNAAGRAAVSEQLTIIIPAFRCVAYLPAAAASALHSGAQHILIAYDGGDAGVLRLARELAAAHSDRVRVLASPVNRGTAANLNEAAQEVQTPFFAKLDGDDVLIPGYLESVFPIIASRPRLAILAGRDLRIAAGEALDFRPDLLPSIRPHAALQVMAGGEAYRFIIRWNPNPTSSGAIYRTDAFREVGGFDRQISWGEDWEIWLRLARDWEVGYIDTLSALYRIHDQSATAAANRQHRLCYGYDAVFRRAAELCEDAEIVPLIRQRMFVVAKLYAAAAARQLRRSRRDSIDCGRRAVEALSIALGRRRPARSRRAPAQS